MALIATKATALIFISPPTFISEAELNYFLHRFSKVAQSTNLLQDLTLMLTVNIRETLCIHFVLGLKLNIKRANMKTGKIPVNFCSQYDQILVEGQVHFSICNANVIKGTENK